MMFESWNHHFILPSALRDVHVIAGGQTHVVIHHVCRVEVAMGSHQEVKGDAGLGHEPTMLGVVYIYIYIWVNSNVSQT